MTKIELVAAVADKASITKKNADLAIRAISEVITEALADGEDVVITGFGKFTTIESAARTARNPQTGEEIEIPAKVKPKFKAGKSLKEAVNA